MRHFTCSINVTRKDIPTTFRFSFHILNKINGYFVRQGNCNEESHNPDSLYCVSIHHCNVKGGQTTERGEYNWRQFLRGYIPGPRPHRGGLGITGPMFKGSV